MATRTMDAPARDTRAETLRLNDTILPYGDLASSSGRAQTRSAHRFGATEREHLIDRLQRLRGILPVFAQELASARRQAAALRVENRGLQEEVRRLRAQRCQGDLTP